MATFEESFVYPLILLLVGAGLSGVLVTWLSHWLENRRKKREIDVENRRKELEIKVNIVSKMSEAVAYQMANAQASTSLRKKTSTDADKDAYHEKLRKWHIEVGVINSKLEIYFSGTDIRERWEIYSSALQSYTDASQVIFYQAPSQEAKKFLKERLEFIKNYFSDKTKIDWNRFTREMTYDRDLWLDVLLLYQKRADEIIKDVLKLPIKVF